MKKLKFGEIRIYFKDGKSDTIPKKLWDDYEYYKNWLVVKRGSAWVYVYDMADITAVIVETKKIKK